MIFKNKLQIIDILPNWILLDDLLVIYIGQIA